LNGGYSNYGIISIQPDAQAAAVRDALFGKTDGFPLVGGNKQFSLAGGPAGCGGRAQLLDIKQEDAGTQIFAQIMIAQAANVAAFGDEGNITAWLAGQNNNHGKDSGILRRR
jgi:hypothetical protein